MGAHEATMTVEPIWYQWQRVLRTIVQTVLAFLIAFGGSVGLLQALAPQILAALVDVLPPAIYAWLAGVFAVAIAIAGTLAKIMAIPQVNAWLTSLHIGSIPKAEAVAAGSAGEGDDQPAEATTVGFPNELRSPEPPDALG